MMKLQPIVPFEPIKTDNIPRGDNWISQVKWDGVRLLTYFDGESVQLYNRRRNERTLHYPELHAIRSFCDANSVILDGEIIALDENGKPSFPTVMKRDGLRRMDKVAQVKQFVPVTYMLFDVIYYNGNWINDYPLAQRLQLLSNIVIPTPTVQLVPSFQDSAALFAVMQKERMEGIVVKDLNSPYQIGSKSHSWQKKKNYLDLNAVIAGVTLSSGVINSLLLGLYNHTEQLIYIGHAGTGKLKQAERKQLTEQIKLFVIKHCPFSTVPERSKNTIWLQPLLTVKVHFLEWLTSNRLRQPSVQAFVDVPPSECKFETN